MNKHPTPIKAIPGDLFEPVQAGRYIPQVVKPTLLETFVVRIIFV